MKRIPHNQTDRQTDRQTGIALSFCAIRAAYISGALCPWVLWAGRAFDILSQLHLLKRNRGDQSEQRRRLLHMKGRKIVSTLLALLLLASLPVSALAATWDIGKGDITVNAGSGGQTVTQGAQVDVPDDAPVITGSSKEHSVTINAEKRSDRKRHPLRREHRHKRPRIRPPSPQTARAMSASSWTAKTRSGVR